METTIDRETRLRYWLSQRILAVLDHTGTELDPDAPLTEYGMDSVTALMLVGDIEDELDVEVDPSAMASYPTLNGLTDYLTELGVAAPAC